MIDVLVDRWTRATVYYEPAKCGMMRHTAGIPPLIKVESARMRTIQAE
jgi:hypothetical protein